MHQSILAYGEFVIYMQENVEAVLNKDGETEVCLTEIEKNNGIRSEIMTVRKCGETAASVFYMRDMYEQYLRGIPVDDLIDQVLYICGQEIDSTFSSAGEWFESFENVREHIIIKVVNYEHNYGKLQTCPYIKKLDLALTFRVLVEEGDTQIGTVLVNHEMMKSWGTTEEELFELAIQNMRQLWHAVLSPVQEMAREMMDESMSKEYDLFLEENAAAQEMPLYVLTNEIRLNGASVIFYTDALRQFANSVAGDVFVLPSSIHEVLLIPVMEGMSAWDMRQVVEEVNHQLVSEEEVLSKHVYRYLYRRDRLIIAA